MEIDIECIECYGSGERECDDCGQDCECFYCHGTGYDPDMVDVSAYKIAQRDRWKRMIVTGCYITAIDVSEFYLSRERDKP